MILLDTHSWLWWLLGDGDLSRFERDELDRLAVNRLISISWVSVWETEMLERQDLIRLEPNFTEWIKKAANPDFLTILPVDTEVIIAQRTLPESFHADPADRLLVATAILSGYPFATYDSAIIQSEVCSIWATN